MLVIRLQRTGRKGHAQFRVVVQDSRRTPTSGRIVALLGSYNPHTKAAVLQKDLTEKYLANGAQPSERVARLLQTEGVTLPKWVKVAEVDKSKATRNPDKLRKNRPAEEPVAEPEAPAEEAAEATEQPADAEA